MSRTARFWPQKLCTSVTGMEHDDRVDGLVSSFITLFESEDSEIEVQQLCAAAGDGTLVPYCMRFYYPVVDVDTEMRRTDVVTPYPFIRYAERPGIADIVCAPTPLSVSERQGLCSDLNLQPRYYPYLFVHNNTTGARWSVADKLETLLLFKDDGIVHVTVPPSVFDAVLSQLAVEVNDFCANQVHRNTPTSIKRMSVSAVIGLVTKVMYDLPSEQLHGVELLISASHGRCAYHSVADEVPEDRQDEIFKRMRLWKDWMQLARGFPTDSVPNMEPVDMCLEIISVIDGPTGQMRYDARLFVLALMEEPESASGHWVPHNVHYNSDYQQLELRWRDLRAHDLIVSVDDRGRWGFVDNHPIYGYMYSIALSCDTARTLLRTCLQTYTRQLK